MHQFNVPPLRGLFANMANKEETPKVGVAVIMMRKNKLLMGLRGGSHGDGMWGLPGGSLAIGETLFECAAREVWEEFGVVIDGVRKIGFANNIMLSEGLHYVTLFVQADWDASQQPSLQKHSHMTDMEWFAWKELPPNLFGSVRSLASGEFWARGD